MLHTNPVTRRAMLRGTGALLTLPWLESLLASPPADANAEEPVRFIGLYHPNGVNPYKWYPAQSGRTYEMPENLALLREFREEMTVFSGLAHFRTPQNAGHWGVSNLLTGYGNGAGIQYGNSISLDQHVARYIGTNTRVQSLNLSRRSGVGALNTNIVTMSFGERGSPIPAESSPRRVFQQLFVEPTPEARAQIEHLHSRNQSILDSVREDTASLNLRLGNADRQKLDNYLTNVRSVEQRMAANARWRDMPRYQVDERTTTRMLGADRHDHDLMMDLIFLALMSDTTRVVTYVQMEEPGLYHGTSHWNRNPDRLLPEMDRWDRQWLSGLARLAGRLKETQQGEKTLLDRTVIVYGGGHGRRPHFSHDLPVLLLGGNDLGFRHGQHLAFAPEQRTPLANMFVSVANAMGVRTPRFADSTGPLAGLA